MLAWSSKNSRLWKLSLRFESGMRHRVCLFPSAELLWEVVEPSGSGACLVEADQQQQVFAIYTLSLVPALLCFLVCFHVNCFCHRGLRRSSAPSLPRRTEILQTVSHTESFLPHLWQAFWSQWWKVNQHNQDHILCHFLTFQHLSLSHRPMPPSFFLLEYGETQSIINFTEGWET